MNPPTESGLKRSQKYRFSGTELNLYGFRLREQKFKENIKQEKQMS